MSQKTYDPDKKFVGSVLPTPRYKNQKWQGVHELKERKRPGKSLQYEWKTDWSDGTLDAGVVDAKHAAPAEHPDAMNGEPPPTTQTLELPF